MSQRSNNNADDRKDPPGTHRYSRGPQIITDAKGVVLANAATLTKARRIRQPGQRIRSANVTVSAAP